MGDVLSGVIGALLAQGLEPALALSLAVTVHACAADRAARDGERGLLASDLLPVIRHLLNPAVANDATLGDSL
jgi:NAD(P)H-hydrate repair Nnr-like enzyme with NAD(P)H-hydrate dehydratase domain